MIKLQMFWEITERRHFWILISRVYSARTLSFRLHSLWIRLRVWIPRGAGAGRRVRTDDLLITNQLLYQLSYTGIAPALF